MSTNAAGRRAERGRQARSGASEGRCAEAPHVGDQVGVRGDPGVRGCKCGEQDRRIVVESVQRHPGHATILGRPTPPAGSTCRSPPAPSRRPRGSARSPGADQVVSAHGPRPGRRDRDLGVVERPADLDGRSRTGRVLDHGHPILQRGLVAQGVRRGQAGEGCHAICVTTPPVWVAMDPPGGAPMSVVRAARYRRGRREEETMATQTQPGQAASWRADLGVPRSARDAPRDDDLRGRGPDPGDRLERLRPVGPAARRERVHERLPSRLDVRHQAGLPQRGGAGQRGDRSSPS